jgi:hypothetical protein
MVSTKTGNFGKKKSTGITGAGGTLTSFYHLLYHLYRGDLIETVIRNADSTGYFSHLERQMCNFTGATGEKSPDRLDALVWAITELMDGGNPGLTY